MLAMLGAQAGRQTVAQQAIPDAPKPRVTLPDVNSVTPGQGTASSSDGAETPAGTSGTPTTIYSAGNPNASGQPQQSKPTPGVDIPAGKGEEAIQTLMVHVDAVDVPFTVKDSKGRLVPGLHPRDVLRRRFARRSPGDVASAA